MLYGGLDMQSAKSGKSKCRNTAIAESFRYMGLIEAWGTGIPRMIKECREYGLREPVFEELGDSIRVTLFRKNEELEMRKRVENIQNTENKYQYMNNINSENLASVVKEQTVEYGEQNHCFNIEKPLFYISKPQENSGDYYLKMKKTLFNTLDSQGNEKNTVLMMRKHYLKQQVEMKPTVLKRLCQLQEINIYYIKSWKDYKPIKV